MADIAVRGVTKSYDGTHMAVDAVDLDVADGELLVLVGPSGCGKSTLLRMIAGLEEVTDGAIAIGGEDVTRSEPKDRDIAMVFQSYALYPHMSVARNIGYPLKLAKRPKDEIARRVAEVADVLQLTEVLGRRPSQLSGGQRQRVAMGRAIIRHPRAFLMDEPLSNLDAKLRVEMRAEIARLQRELAVTTVYVTHDQTEAMTMGTRVAVLRDGVLQQVDTPQRLYDEPVNQFVATFIGSPAMNLLPGTVEAADGDADAGAGGRGGLALRVGSHRLALDAAVAAAHPGLAARAGVAWRWASGRRRWPTSPPTPACPPTGSWRPRSTSSSRSGRRRSCTWRWPPTRRRRTRTRRRRGARCWTAGAGAWSGSVPTAAWRPATWSSWRSTRPGSTCSTPRPGCRSVADTVVAGLDVGGTKTLAVAVDAATDAVLATVRRPTGAGGEGLLRSTGDVLAELAGAAGLPVDGFAAVGVGVPGLVDRAAGTVRHAVNLGLGDDPVGLAGHLGRLAGAPVVVDNDVNLAALGAAVALGCRGDLAYLSVGTGLAAGLLLGGRIRRGAHGAAGEIGHLPVDPDGPLCECGQRGCLEALASGAAIAARWPAGDGEVAATTSLLAAAAAGDPAAETVLAEVAGHLAGAVALLAQTVDPELVVLGGGVAEAGTGLLDAVRDALRRRAGHAPVLAAIDLADRVALVPEGVPAGALGAAVLARRHLERSGDLAPVADPRGECSSEPTCRSGAGRSRSTWRAGASARRCRARRSSTPAG